MSNSKRTYTPTLGDKIRAARKDSGYSQREFGDALKLSDKAISSYEVDRALPTIDTLREMSRLTQKPVNYFLDDGDQVEIELHSRFAAIERQLEEIKQLLQKRDE
jgi:transcriptional regulator with XRE-family HTH domain